MMNAGQAKRIQGHLEVGRQFYNAVLSAGQRRLRHMRADPDWQTARALPRTQKLVWKSSRSYQKTRQRKATRERKLAAHRQSLHGRKVHEIVAVGNTILLEMISSTDEARWKRGRNTRTPRF